MSGRTMALRLDEHLDRPLLYGEGSEAARLAMRIIVRMAEIAGADRLLSIEGAHIDSSVYLGPATLDFAERLAAAGGRVVVPSTLNVSGVDEHGWRRWAVPSDWAEQASRQMRAYLAMGCAPTWTCAPYQGPARPTFGQQLAWGESNAIAFANTVIGARTERYPDLLDICAAITGRVPAVGLHLDEHRAGRLAIRLKGIPVALQEHPTFLPVLGHAVGRRAGELVPVVEGLDVPCPEDRLKGFCAAAASSGAVALCHLIGITPEASSRADAFQGGQPLESVELTVDDLRAARAELTRGHGHALDLVVLGSPHFSLQEFRDLAPLVRGRRKHDRLRFLVTSSRMMVELAERAGLLAALRDFGGELTVDTCILTSPMLPPGLDTLMTNSAKYAYYSPGLLGMNVVFGSLADCVDSAVAGRVVIDEGPWGS